MYKVLAEELKQRSIALKPTNTHEHRLTVDELVTTETSAEDDAKRREYFFQAAVDEWYNLIPQHTFRSAFVSLSPTEARIIIQYWKEYSEKADKEEVKIPLPLEPLVNRIDCAMTEFFGNEGIFVKLSTRSPKDSKTIFRTATDAFHRRLDENMEHVVQNNEVPGTTSINARLVAFSEEMVKASIAHNGREAVTYLLDSWRVAEDLMYAYESEDSGETEGKVYPISLVLRQWDSRITPVTEFRGFVWNGQLNCIGQYWHSLYWPHLKTLKDQIASDCREFFEKIRSSLPVPNAMLDLAWVGPGEVLLVEVNPLMEGLGSFKGSTGLFDFYNDHELLTGLLPFEIRVREEEEDRSSLLSHMSMAWRQTVLGM